MDRHTKSLSDDPYPDYKIEKPIEVGGLIGECIQICMNLRYVQMYRSIEDLYNHLCTDLL